MNIVGLLKSCETSPKAQCKECLLYWNQGIVYCICGHLLRENQSSRGILRWTLDLLSIPNCVIKTGRHHGHRYGKTEEQKDNYIAHIQRRRCKKRGFEGIHDRLLKDPVAVALQTTSVDNRSILILTILHAGFVRGTTEYVNPFFVVPILSVLCIFQECTCDHRIASLLCVLLVLRLSSTFVDWIQPKKSSGVGMALYLTCDCALCVCARGRPQLEDCGVSTAPELWCSVSFG